MGLDAPPSSEQLAAHWRPCVEPCVDLFGADRCVAESNFPVEKICIGFAARFNALKRLTAGCSSDEKSALLAGTARRVYRLDC
ncbi:MAG: amidohydrolase family protein [Rhodopila sp.]|jgi:predicted TIM-barrel fold metal-dependent hydrolase